MSKSYQVVGKEFARDYIEGKVSQAQFLDAIACGNRSESIDLNDLQAQLQRIVSISEAARKRSILTMK